MRLFRVLLGSLIALLMLTGTGSAAYDPGRDVTLSLSVAPKYVRTDRSTGQQTFAAQEAAHSMLSSSTGQSVDHYYVWVEVNGQRVLAVDPLCSYEYD